MPMIDVYATAGTFSDPHQLAVDLASGLDLGDRVEQVTDQFLADQVQRRVVERENAERPVLRELDPRVSSCALRTLSSGHRTAPRFARVVEWCHRRCPSAACPCGAGASWV